MFALELNLFQNILSNDRRQNGNNGSSLYKRWNTFFRKRRRSQEEDVYKTDDKNHILFGHCSDGCFEGFNCCRMENCFFYRKIKMFNEAQIDALEELIYRRVLGTCGDEGLFNDYQFYIRLHATFLANKHKLID